MSDLNKLLEELSILIFEADKSKHYIIGLSLGSLSSWSKNFEDYKIEIDYHFEVAETKRPILNGGFDLLFRIDGYRQTAIIEALENCINPEIFSEINKTIDKIVLLIKLERMKNAQT